MNILGQASAKQVLLHSVTKIILPTQSLLEHSKEYTVVKKITERICEN